MSADRTDGVATLETAVARVPGVARLYPAGALLGRVASAVVVAAGGAAGGEEIAVDGVHVAIRIGVDVESSAAQVCREVYTVARSWTRETGRDDLNIQVIVVGMEERPSA